MSKPSLPRILRPIDCVTIVVTSIIGAGIFATPQRVAHHLGSFDELVGFWVAGALFAFVGGLVHAELGTRLPDSGGAYLYLVRAFGPRLGFLEGWKSLLVSSPAARAALSVAAAEYVGFFVDLDPWRRTLVAAGILVASGMLNVVGLRWSIRYQHLSAATKVGGLLALVVLGAALVPTVTHPAAAAPDPSSSPLVHVLAAGLLIYYAYNGCSRLGYVGGEIRNPSRTLPLALASGLIIVAVIYVGINVFYVRALGLEAMRASTAVAADAAAVVIGPSGGAMVALIAIVSASGTVVSSMMAISRAYYAMAHDRLLFRWLDFVHPRFRTPSRAILLHLVICLVMLFLKRNFVDLATSFVFAGLAFQGLRTIALFRLRARGVGDASAYRSPFHPLFPSLYLAGIVALVSYRTIYDWDRAAVDLAVLALGIPVGEIWIRMQRRRGIEPGRAA